MIRANEPREIVSQTTGLAYKQGPRVELTGHDGPRIASILRRALETDEVEMTHKEHMAVWAFIRETERVQNQPVPDGLEQKIVDGPMVRGRGEEIQVIEITVTDEEISEVMAGSSALRKLLLG